MALITLVALSVVFAAFVAVSHDEQNNEESREGQQKYHRLLCTTIIHWHTFISATLLPALIISANAIPETWFQASNEEEEHCCERERSYSSVFG